MFSRRSMFMLAGAAAALPALTGTGARAQGAAPAPATTDDPRMGQRSLGSATAPVVVNEWFSLTCTHCAAFQKETFPRVKTELIDTGKVLYVWKDFPLDQVALTAAMVARSLPTDRYEPFITSLLATQDRWAYARGVNTTDELAKMAALAGMPRSAFNTAIADAGLRNAILAGQDTADKVFHVNSTPTFILNPGKPNQKAVPGAVGFDDFAKAVASV